MATKVYWDFSYIHLNCRDELHHKFKICGDTGVTHCSVSWWCGHIYFSQNSSLSGECFTVNLWNNPKKVSKLFSAYSVQWAVCTVQRVISKSMERVWNVHLGNPLGPPPTHHNFYLVLSTWCTASLSTLPSSTFRALQSLHKLKLVIHAELFIFRENIFFWVQEYQNSLQKVHWSLSHSAEQLQSRKYNFKAAMENNSDNI